jgi:hypothetical protein
LDGQVAAKFPETANAHITIQIDFYDVPEAEVAEFVERFSKGVFQGGDYQKALEQSKKTCGIDFTVNFDRLH